MKAPELQGSMECVDCGRTMNEKVLKCCCSHATYEDGSHCDATCVECCGPTHLKNNPRAGAANHLRMDCDQ